MTIFKLCDWPIFQRRVILRWNYGYRIGPKSSFEKKTYYYQTFENSPDARSKEVSATQTGSIRGFGGISPVSQLLQSGFFWLNKSLFKRNHCLNLYWDSRLAHPNFSINFPMNLSEKFYSTFPCRTNSFVGKTPTTNDQGYAYASHAVVNLTWTVGRWLRYRCRSELKFEAYAIVNLTSRPMWT